MGFPLSFRTAANETPSTNFHLLLYPIFFPIASIIFIVRTGALQGSAPHPARFFVKKRGKKLSGVVYFNKNPIIKVFWNPKPFFQKRFWWGMGWNPISTRKRAWGETPYPPDGRLRQKKKPWFTRFLENKYKIGQERDSSRSSSAWRTAAMTNAEKLQSLPRMASSTCKITSLGKRMVLFVVGGMDGILNLLTFSTSQYTCNAIILRQTNLKICIAFALQM